ncbi:MAG TPA: glycosyltransferase family 39 protein [Chitinophagaceae bacterium]
MQYKKALALLIILATISRCVIASNIEFGNDEAYYWTYGLRLQWNYFDHPLMVALLIRATTLNLLFGHIEFFVRLGSIVCSGISTFFIFKMVCEFHSERAGYFAALLYNASFYASIIAGIFILPDAPQMLFWTASLWLLSVIVKLDNPPAYLWMTLGVGIGLTIMSKVHGAFIEVGLLLYIVFFKRQYLRSWKTYTLIIASGLVAAPILIWNVQNHFATFRYHSARVGGVHLKMDNFFREIFGEVFYNNPINFVLTAMALTYLLSRFRQTKQEILKVLALIACPMIVSLIILSLFNDTLPHWSGPAYVTLIPVVAVYVSDRFPKRRGSIVIYSSISFAVIIAAAAVTLIHQYPGTFGKRTAKDKFGQGDVTLDMYGWSQAAKIVDSVIQSDQAAHTMPDSAEFVMDKWFPAAHIDYYLARPLQKFVVGLGTMGDLHHYIWLNKYRLKNRSLGDSYCVFPSNYPADLKSNIFRQFGVIECAGIFPILRNGKVCRYFYVYRLRNFRGKVPMAE